MTVPLWTRTGGIGLKLSHFCLNSFMDSFSVSSGSIPMASRDLFLVLHTLDAIRKLGGY